LGVALNASDTAKEPCGMEKKSDDNRGFLAQFMPYEPQLRGFFQRRLRRISESEDLTQEVLLRALKVSKEQEINNPRAFLFGIARNVIMQSNAKRSRSLIDAIEDLAPSTELPKEDSTEDVILVRERWSKFVEATTELPPQCQKVFILKKVYGYSNKEIASKLKISTSTVEKHIASGLRKVRDKMIANDMIEEFAKNGASSAAEARLTKCTRNDG